MFYRYEFDSKCEYPHTGILCGLDDLFDEYSDTLFKLIAYFEDNLECPTCFKESNMQLVCYFTKKGNRKFHKAIKQIKDEVKKLGVNVVRLEIRRDSIDKIYYEDKYQVVIDYKYIDKSISKIF